jgi:hypothetical protein
VSKPSPAVAASPAATLCIVCTYADGTLPAAWFRAYKRIKQTVKRGSFNARVQLAPIQALPDRVDLLIVPTALAESAIAARPATERLVVAADQVQREFDRLAERLEREGRLTRTPGAARAIAVHRGFRAVTDRARLPD